LTSTQAQQYENENIQEEKGNEPNFMQFLPEDKSVNTILPTFLVCSVITTVQPKRLSINFRLISGWISYALRTFCV